MQEGRNGGWLRSWSLGLFPAHWGWEGTSQQELYTSLTGGLCLILPSRAVSSTSIDNETLAAHRGSLSGSLSCGPSSLKTDQRPNFTTPSTRMATPWGQTGTPQSFGSQQYGKTQDITGVGQRQHLTVSQSRVTNPIYKCKVSIGTRLLGWVGKEL